MFLRCGEKATNYDSDSNGFLLFTIIGQVYYRYEKKNQL
jgi:hypothetical protein